MLEIKNIVDDLPTHKSKIYKRRKLKDIEAYAFHHSATKSGSPNAFANFHVNTNGWPGIGYHFVIDIKSQVYQTNCLSTVSYNVGGKNNKKVIGICVVGNFQKFYPRQGQIDKSVLLVNYLNSMLGTKNVTKHGDWKSTSCPGMYFPIDIIRMKTIFNHA